MWFHVVCTFQSSDSVMSQYLCTTLNTDKRKDAAKNEA